MAYREIVNKFIRNLIICL